LLLLANAELPRSKHRSLGAAAAGVGRRPTIVGMNRRWLLPTLASLELLLLALNSHAVAGSTAPAVLLMVDWAHLALGGVWVGGLAMLAIVVLPASRNWPLGHDFWLPGDFVQPVISRFARVALVAAAGLGLTGLIMASVQLGSLQNLLATGYGWALVVKTAVFAAALALAAEHRFVLLPMLKSADPAAAYPVP